MADGTVRIYRDWVGHRLGSPMRRVRSYFQTPRRRHDLTSRHDPATAIPDDPWYASVEGLYGGIVTPLWLLLCGLVEAGVYAAVAAGSFATATVLRRPWSVVVERDAEVIERQQVVGWWRSRALLRRLQDQHG